MPKMPRSFSMFKRFRKTGLVLLLSAGIFFSFRAVDDYYFEVSKNLDIFATMFRDVNTYYVDSIEPGSFMKTGMDAMLRSLDPYTVYIPESDIEDYRFMTTGQYGGVGATIRKSNDFVVVAEPYEGFPAYKADLRAGDKIVEIDGKSAKGKNTMIRFASNVIPVKELFPKVNKPKFVKVAQEKGIVSSKDLYEVKPKASDDMTYKNNIMEIAHPNSLVIAPAYDKINGLVENNIERQNILLNIVNKETNGLLTQHKYASNNLILCCSHGVYNGV